MTVKTIDDTTLSKELGADSMVVVDVYTEWCGPCQHFAKVFQRAAEEYPDISFCKINADENPGFRDRVKVTSLPFVAAFRAGQLIKAESMSTQAALNEFIQSL